MKYVCLLFFTFLTLQSSAQLLPSIGLNSLPANNNAICNIPWYLGSFYTSGLAKNTYAHDFKLYDVNGDSLVLSQKLAVGKPVLLIAGSLTCPVFMGKIPIINQVVSTYGSQLQVYVIYVLEAHPIDTSVYFGYINITSSNTNSGILFPQPTTYGARKHMVDTMSFWNNVNAPIFIDGPCNEWWSTFGPAPNNAYLIDTNGLIYAKHGWFHKNNDNIFCDVDSLLGTTSGLCNTVVGNGNFQIQVLNNSAVGPGGSILYDYAHLINNTASNISVGIKKLQKNLPPTWQTAFCADVCYAATDDSITVTIPANDTLLFSLDFITDTPPDSGNVNVGFRNIMNTNNSYQVKMSASTYPSSINHLEEEPFIEIFPNPANDRLYITSKSIIHSLEIVNTVGQYFYKNSHVDKQFEIDMSHLPNGIYFIKVLIDKKTKVLKIEKR